MEELLEKLQKRIEYRYKDISLLKVALTHTSIDDSEDYERLEFLGDRVLGLTVAEFLYKNFTEENEGDLAKRFAALVDKTTLAKLATEIELGSFIKVAETEGEQIGTCNESIIADVMEAVIASIYLDAGLEEAKKFIMMMWGDELYKLSEPPQEPKTALQEWSQGLGLGLPKYEVTGRDGPDHAPVFEISVNVEGFSPIKAKGSSRKAAEKVAAQKFIDKNVKG